jgi:hypothetical protein
VDEPSVAAKPIPPPFVSHVGPQPASFLQASHLIGGKVLTFQAPLASLGDADIASALAALKAEVEKAAV